MAIETNAVFSVEPVENTYTDTQTHRRSLELVHVLCVGQDKVTFLEEGVIFL